MTTPSNQDIILILGYYDKHNLGDDAYKLAFPILLNQNNINSQIIFANPEQLTQIPNDVKVVICGGGDIINDYFNEKFEKLLSKSAVKVYAISIGITYESTICQKYLGRFEQIYVRHLQYHKELSTLKKTENIFHIPDIAFLLPPQKAITPTKPIIGVFLATKIDITPAINALIKHHAAILSSQYDLIFYAFNTSDKSHESDVVFVKQNFPNAHIGPLIQSPIEMLKLFSQLHLAICVRYHSHIFSIIQQIPFISVNHTPKSKFLLKDNNFNSNIYNPSDPPARLLNLVDQHLTPSVRQEMTQKLSQVYRDSVAILKNLKILNNIPKTIDQIYFDCKALLDKNTSHDIVVSHALYNITKSVQSKYTYGFIDGLKNTTENLYEQIKWVFEDFAKNHNLVNINLLQQVDEFRGVHRSGWEFVTRFLKQFESPTGITCDTYVDGTFGWNEKLYYAQGIIPFKRDWIGFIHHTQHPTYNDYNLQNLFANHNFQISLKFCKALITLSEHNRLCVQEKLNQLGIKIKTFSLKHPTEMTSRTFSYFNFASNPRFVQIGSWLRDPYAIYSAPLQFGTKHILIGKDMNNLIHPNSVQIKIGHTCGNTCDCHNEQLHKNSSVTCNCIAELSKPNQNNQHNICRLPTPGNVLLQFLLKYLWENGAPQWLTLIVNGNGCNCNEEKQHWSKQSLTTKRNENRIRKLNQIIRANQNSVAIIPQLSNYEYDKLLQSCVVFVKLEDAAAVNTIIECIVRNTPIIINRLPSVVEYLGPNYPLYYNDQNDISKIDLKQIQRAHIYLSKLDKKEFMIDHFMNEFRENIIA